MGCPKCKGLPRISQDCGDRVTIGTVVERVSQKLLWGTELEACNELDRLFILGAWAHRLCECVSPENYLLNKNIRGLMVTMFKAGRKAEAEYGDVRDDE